MEDIGLVNQGWNWLLSQKGVVSRALMACGCAGDNIWSAVDRNWPVVCCGCQKLMGFLGFALLHYIYCVKKGFQSLVGLESAALLVIMWSCFLSLTSMSCLVYLLISMGIAGTAIRYLGNTPGLFIVGVFAILILWTYANIWITGTLLLVGGYLFSLNHARLVVLLATIYSVYSVQAQAGWFGVFLCTNLAFLSNDAFNFLLHWCDKINETTPTEDHKPSEPFAEDVFSSECEFSVPSDETEKAESCKAPPPSETTTTTTTTTTTIAKNIKEPTPCTLVVREDRNSLIEMQRILDSADHYETLGISRQKRIDCALLKKEYRKKAMLVHPDKNMGNPQASESFKKLQCAYEVLSDSVKKRDYDEQLRREELRKKSLKSPSSSNQDNVEYIPNESRCIHCTKCGRNHVWVCTSRLKVKARWCQDCGQYHQAKDGDGWVEYKGSLGFDGPQKIDIPRAFVCAESKIFDVSEWAICQGMACRPNTHRPSFHVNMVGLERTTRSNSGRFTQNLDAEMMTDDDEEEFELWLQQALASGLFCETSKRRKTWSPFKLHQMKKQWRRSSSGLT